MIAIDFWEDKKISVPEFRDKIMAIQASLEAMPGSIKGSANIEKVLPLNHSFGDGLYIREIFMPKGMIVLSRIHKYTHPYFITQGKCAVITEEGAVMLEAPHQGITKAGTKRALYIVEDTRWTTVHATNETDPDTIVDEVTVETFEELQEVVL